MNNTSTVPLAPLPAAMPTTPTEEEDLYCGVHFEVADVINRGRYVHREAFDQTMRETDIQWSAELRPGLCTLHFGRRGEEAVMLLELAGDGLHIVYFPNGVPE